MCNFGIKQADALCFLAVAVDDPKAACAACHLVSILLSLHNTVREYLTRQHLNSKAHGSLLADLDIKLGRSAQGFTSLRGTIGGVGVEEARSCGPPSVACPSQPQQAAL